MYSPKIKEELIPRIYEIAKAKGVQMTTLVNEILQNALNAMGSNPKGGIQKGEKKDETSNLN